jgi:plastocyanin
MGDMIRSLILIPLACVALVAGGCGDDDDSSSSGDTGTESSSAPAPSSGGAVAVDMKNIQFSPKDVTVKVGQKVTWTNQDTVDHDVKADEGADFHSETFGKGGTYEFTPKEAGVVKYECTLHPGMVGELKVVK